MTKVPHIKDIEIKIVSIGEHVVTHAINTFLRKKHKANIIKLQVDFVNSKGKKTRESYNVAVGDTLIFKHLL